MAKGAITGKLDAAPMRRAVAAMIRKVDAEVVRRALAPAAEIVERAIAAETPARSGRLRRSLATQAGRSKKSRFVTVRMKAYRGATFYGSFIQYGYRVGSRKLGDRRRQVAANPFFSRGVAKSQGPAVRAIAGRLGRLIQEAARRSS